jgi:hypothetical protein
LPQRTAAYVTQDHRNKSRSTQDSATAALRILPIIFPRLDAEQQARVLTLGQTIEHALTCGFFPISPLANPGILRTKKWGRPKAGLAAAHDCPSPLLICHFSWTFLTDTDRAALVCTSPPMHEYAASRRRAYVHRSSLKRLKLPRPPLIDIPPLCHKRARQMAAALVCFDFNYGDLVRWLGGEYTNQMRDWTELMESVTAIRALPIPKGQPPIEYDKCLKLCSDGAPLQGEFLCARKDTLERIKYDNHPPLQAVLPAVRKKFAKEEAHSYHLHFPKWVAFFLYGLFISPISWIVRKTKGRIVIDSSTVLRPADTGAPNSYIPTVGTDGREDECPAVHFGDALKRHLERIWNMRIDHPTEDLLQHGDDIGSAFRRVLYHPDMAVVFAYIFMEFLIIPIGTIFGARNSPSNFCLLAELRAFIGNNKNFREDSATPLTDDLSLVPDMTPVQRELIPRAVADSIHHGVALSAFPERSHLTMYVDDNIVVALRDDIADEVRRAEGSAYVVFGRPGKDRRGSVLQEDKWEPVAHFKVHHLGFNICTRAMSVDWPRDKRQLLGELIRVIMARPKKRTSPIELATVLGVLRNGATICPLGNF